jgi:hypothetical protein
MALVRNILQVCKLREAFLEDCSSPPRVMLRAILLGALHGPLNKGKPTYLSNHPERRAIGVEQSA